MNPQKKDQKKLSPDFKDDQGTKKYNDEDAMDILAGIDPTINDDFVPLDDEVVDDNKDKKPGHSPEKSDDEETSTPDVEVDEVLGDEGDEEVEETSDEPEPKTSSRKGEISKSELQEIIEQKDAKIAELNEKVRSLEERVSKLGNVQNVVKELGFDELPQHELVQTMKELKTVAFDFVNNEKFLEIVDGFASGKFRLADQEEKPVSAYMPKGMEDEYDHYDAFNDPKSPSWKARELWEAERRKQELEMRKLIESVTSRKKALEGLGGDIPEQLKKYKEIASSRMKALRKYAIDEYEDGEGLFSDFKEKLRNLDEDVLKVVLAVVAKRTNRPSKVDKKKRDNKGKIFAESKVSRGIGSEEGELIAIDEKTQKELEDTFLDWRNDDLNIIR